MSDESTDPSAKGANDSEPQDSDAIDLTDTGETEIDIPGSFDMPEDLSHLLAEFLASINPADIDNLAWGFPYLPPRPPVVATNNQALQNYLVQMQTLAGIPPHDVVSMQLPAPPSRRGTSPAIIQFRDEGSRLPIIPPLTFDGTLAPLFVREHRQATPERSNDDAVSLVPFSEELGNSLRVLLKPFPRVFKL